MTYKIISRSCCHLIQQDSEGKEIIQDVTLQTFFEIAQSLGFFPEGQDFQEDSCLVVWDFYGEEKSVHRAYQSMLEADCFGTEDLEKIIQSFFDTFPEKVYWIQANKIEVLHRTPKTSNVNEKCRIYSTTTGTTRHVHQGFLDTEWSEYQTNKKTALEMLLKQLEGQVLVVKNQIENI